MEAVAGFEPAIYRMQSEHCTTEHRKPSVNNFKTQKKSYLFLLISVPQARWISWLLFLQSL